MLSTMQASWPNLIEFLSSMPCWLWQPTMLSLLLAFSLRLRSAHLHLHSCLHALLQKLAGTTPVLCGQHGHSRHVGEGVGPDGFCWLVLFCHDALIRRLPQCPDRAAKWQRPCGS
jgi:hypothetical protein